MIWGNPLEYNFFVFIRITRKKLEKKFMLKQIFLVEIVTSFIKEKSYLKVNALQHKCD